jgi:SSS family solute:Na+ symporter
MGVLLAGGLQLLLPLATCFPGMIYYAINPNLEDHNAAYPAVVAALVTKGLRGLVVAAVLGAIMSTISGLVNSTATIVTLDVFRRWKGKNWPEARLVRFGQWAGGAALLVGALFAPVVMKWDSIFRYCQDIWAPMAAPAVVVFMGGALWKPARERGAVACLWLSILTIPLTFLKSFLADSGAHILPGNLDNSLVFAGGIFLVSVVLLAALSLARSVAMGLSWSVVLGFVIFFLVEYQPAIAAVLIMAVFVIATAYYCYTARKVAPNMWDRSMVLLPKGESEKWYFSIWFWWLVLAGVFAAIYIKFS